MQELDISNPMIIRDGSESGNHIVNKLMSRNWPALKELYLSKPTNNRGSNNINDEDLEKILSGLPSSVQELVLSNLLAIQMTIG